MGKVDAYQFDYLDNNDRFADQINGALFRGKQVVKPEELEPADMQMVYLGKEAGERRIFKTIVDKTRMWHGSLFHILAVENQTFVDYHMVIRSMLSESLSYQRQWKHKKAAHGKAHDLKAGTDEFLSGMRKDEKFVPIITVVVYFGTGHPWDGAKCLYDQLAIEDELKGFVTNYRLNLYDCHEHDTFEEYHTGLRQLFEVVRYSKDKEKLREVMEENEIMVDGEKKYDLCKAFIDMKMEGKLEYLVKTICIKLKKNKSAEMIADELEEELSEIEKVIEVQNQVGSYDVEQICRRLEKLKV